MPEETIITTVRMSQHTLDQLGSLKESLNAVSISDMIRKAIDLSEAVVDTAKAGGRVILEDKEGKKTQILITGINKRGIKK